MRPTLTLRIRPSSTLRLHPTPVLIPYWHTPAYEHVWYKGDRPAEEVTMERVDMWKRGEWTDELTTPPGMNFQISYKEAVRRGMDAFYEQGRRDLSTFTSTSTSTQLNGSEETDITSHTSAQGDDGDGNGKKGGDDTIQSIPVKKKVPAANVFWTDHLRML